LFWTLRLNLSFNSGAAFGLGAGLGPFILVGAAMLVVVFFVIGRHSLTRSLLLTVALGLVLGGAIGNLIDRVVRDNGGAVIDFIDLRWWPIFNVADAAISVGAVLLVAAGRRPA
jgi:signal peptidase II